jgi:hypothetical protein
VIFLRELTATMHAFAEKEKPVEADEISEWVTKLDFLGNAATRSNDDFIDALRDAGVSGSLNNVLNTHHVSAVL